MDIKEYRVGMRVYDFWWPWTLGIVTKALKTRIKVRFAGNDYDTTYDIPHLKFLTEERMRLR